jgi:hypothetical protein
MEEAMSASNADITTRRAYRRTDDYCQLEGA